MPATAAQKNARRQWRWTNGARRGRKLRWGALMRVSLGRRFFGTATRPRVAAPAATALLTGRLRTAAFPAACRDFWWADVEACFLIAEPACLCCPFLSACELALPCLYAFFPEFAVARWPCWRTVGLCCAVRDRAPLGE